MATFDVGAVRNVTLHTREVQTYRGQTSKKVLSREPSATLISTRAKSRPKDTLVPVKTAGARENTRGRAPKTHIPFLPKEEGMLRPEVMMSPAKWRVPLRPRRAYLLHTVPQ